MDTTTSIRRETVETLRRKLLDRQRALFDDVEGLEGDLRLIEEDRVAEVEARGQGEAMARLLDRVRERDRHELEDIHRALAKIAARVYGRCESCGAPIPVDRLEATPEARHCLACEERQEQAPVGPARPFLPGSHRAVPPEYADLDDAELAEAVRERLRAHDDPDFLRVQVRCHGGVVRLAGDIPSEPQRQVLVQVVADGMGLEVLDRLRVAGLDREDERVGASAEQEALPVEERIPAGRGMRPLAPEGSTVPEDEGEPPETPPESPIPEKA